MQAKIYSYTRFSTKIQMDGDSLRRQNHEIERYASEHGLDIDNSLKLHDEGLSGFHGDNLKKGALGRFLNLVENGKIARGSVLLVENLDRLSRLEPDEVYKLLDRIVSNGITLVSTANGLSFEKGLLNNPQSFILLGELQRAHRESKRKSEMLKAVWNQKRKSGDKKLTGKCPVWLELKANKKEFTVKSEVVKAITQIFEYKLKGLGTERIERLMNERDDLWKPKSNTRRKIGGWRKSYIKYMLRNRQLIGEFQHYTKIEGRRVKEGDPISNYFPKVIDEGLFYSVQKIMDDRKRMVGWGGGKTGKARNLFALITRCALCGSPMHFIDRGKPPKGTQHLQCDSSRRKVPVDGKICTARPILYNKFESRFLRVMDEIDINKLINSKSSDFQALKRANEELNVAQSLKEENERKITNLQKAITETDKDDTRQMFIRELEELSSKSKKLEQDEVNCKHNLSRLQQLEKTTKSSLRTISDLSELLKHCETEQEEIDKRKMLQNEIRAVVKEIRITPFMNSLEAISYIEPKYKTLMKSINGKPTLLQKRKLANYKQFLAVFNAIPTSEPVFFGGAKVKMHDVDEISYIPLQNTQRLERLREQINDAS